MRTLTLLALFWLVVAVTPAARGQAWQPLFDGVSFQGWVVGDGKPVDAGAWEVVDGMLHLDRTKGKGGNLSTDRDYGDFELIFEWTVASGANNGIKYRVRDFDGRTLGVEYQVIDDAAHPKLTPDHRTASIYDIYNAKEHDLLKPAGEFNRGRIVVKHNRIEHWLNGHLIAEAQVGSGKWDEQINKSKFADVVGFGRNQYGRIMITDHKDEVWYRNIFIRDLTNSVSTDQLALGASCCCPRTAATGAIIGRLRARRRR